MNLKKHDKAADKFLDLVFLTPFSVEYRYEEVGFDEELNRPKVTKDVKALVGHVSKIIKQAE